MGVAFAQVVGAFTNRIVSPLIGLIFDLDALAGVWTFGDAIGEDGFPIGSVGAFIEALLNFLIVALVMFFVVRAYNKMQTASEEEEAGPAEDVVLLTEIRDALNK